MFLSYTAHFFSNISLKPAIVTEAVVLFPSFYIKITEEYFILGHDRFLPHLLSFTLILIIDTEKFSMGKLFSNELWRKYNMYNGTGIPFVAFMGKEQRQEAYHQGAVVAWSQGLM
jgi:hypothetical protein